MNRRELARAGAGLAFAAGSQLVSSQSPRSANDRIRVAVIGCGGMGGMDLKDFQSFPEVDIVGLCDPDDSQTAKALRLITRGRPKTERDYRRVLDRKDVDAVIVATPDHWHALIAVDACNAGKDVYVEKPIATTAREGRLMVDAARKNKRVVQVGIQQRSGSHFQRAVELVQNGAIGKVVYAEAWNHGRNSPEGIGRKPASEPPSGLDWDLWLGPAPAVPYRSNLHPVSWRVFYDYGGGNLADWGVHLLDIIQWALKLEAPISVEATGGKYWTDDDRTTPDTISVLYQYPGVMVNYTHMNHCNYGRSGKYYGILFHGSDAALLLDRSGYDVLPLTSKRVISGGETFRGAFDDMVGTGTYFVESRPAEHGSTSLQHVPHVANFLSCLRSRSQPVGDIEIGFKASLPCYLGNIAYRTKHRINWDAKAEKITNHEPANVLLTRQYRNPWRLAGLNT